MWTQAVTESLTPGTGQCVRTGEPGFFPKDYKPTSLLTASIRPFRDGVFNISASKTSSDSFRT